MRTTLGFIVALLTRVPDLAVGLEVSPQGSTLEIKALGKEGIAVGKLSGRLYELTVTPQ